jgi:hypothetical protein
MSYPRTGSSLLTSALQNHPNLKVGGELMNVAVDGYKETYNLDWRNPKFKELYGSENIPFADSKFLDCNDLGLYLTNIFNDFHGFKLIYDQIDLNGTFISQLDKLKDVKLIFMTRNILESCVSCHLALRSGIWFVTKNNESKQIEKIFITPKMFKDYADYFLKCHKNYTNRYTNKIIIDYKELIEDWDGTIDKVQNFLEIKQCKLPQVYGKRTCGNISKIVTNYKDLAYEFRHSEYGNLFTINKIL